MKSLRAGIILLAFLCVVTQAEVVAAQSCPPSQYKNYLAPLQRMPDVREVSPEQRLPFGYPDLRISPQAGLVAGGGQIGFVLESRNTTKVHTLDWYGSARVVRVNANGEPRRIVSSMTFDLDYPRSLGKRPVSLLSRVSSQRAFYRIELTIYKKGRLLARFGDYVRVLPRRVEARLAMSPRVVAPGSAIFVRVLNSGTTYLSYGPPVYLERWTPAGWEEVPLSVFWPPTATMIPAGTSGRCQVVPLPRDLQEGRYRAAKEVSAGQQFSIRKVFQVSRMT